MKKKTQKKHSHGGARLGAGRKPVDNPQRRRTTAVDDARWRRYKRAAKKAGVTLAEFIRDACDRAADDVLD